MARLIAFLATGIGTGFLASVLGIPNMIPIMLAILWVGMGCGLRLGPAMAGALLMPLAVAVPMWLLPPNEYLRAEPPDDSLLAEFYAVSGAPEIHRERRATWRERRTAYREEQRAAGLMALSERPERPTLHEANMLALERAEVEGESTFFKVWPTRSAWAAGLLLTFVAWVVNTVTSRPFREPGELGQE